MTSSGTTIEYEYVYDTGELIRETRTVKVGEIVTSQKAIDYLRLGGELIGFRLYGSSGNTVDYTSYDDYFYARTANGEIRIIYDEDGFVAARYSYDAWGRITGIDEEYSSCIGALNSIRYKDYYYDTESGFYYLQSRYYDPSVCRFISADSTDYLGASGSVLSFNLFGYCENEPVLNLDPIGKGTVGAIIGALLGFGLGAILVPYIANLLKLSGWKKSIFIAVGIAAITGLGAWAGYYIGEAIFGIYSKAKLLAAKVNSAIAHGISNIVGGAIQKAKGDGWVIKIGQMTLRVMTEGAGRANYFRLSHATKGAMTILGTFSNDRASTHINITLQNIIKIIELIIKYK